MDTATNHKVMKEMKFKIPTDKVKTCEKRVARAYDKAIRLGITWMPEMEVGKPEYVPHHSGQGGVFRTNVTIRFPKLTLSDTWVMLAQAHVVNSGKRGRDADDVRNEVADVVITANKGVEVPEDAWCVTHTCSHCGYVRWRKLYYVLECVKDTTNGSVSYKVGDVVKVGSQCVGEFLGEGALGLIQAMEALVTWGENCMEKAANGGYKEKPLYPVLPLITHVCDIMRQDDGKYYPSTKGEKSTAKRAFNRWKSCDLRHVKKLYPMSQDVVETAQIVYDWVASQEMEHTSEQRRNVYHVYAPYAITVEDMQKYADLVAGGVLLWDRTYNPEKYVLKGEEINPATLTKGDEVSIVGECIRRRDGRTKGRNWHLHVVKCGSHEYVTFTNGETTGIQEGDDVRLEGVFAKKNTWSPPSGQYTKVSYQLDKCTVERV